MTEQQKEFVKQVREFCNKHYKAGGDTIIECFSDDEIVEQFKSLNDVKRYFGLRIEAELNTRWGEDTDPQSERYRKWDEIDK